MENTSDQYKWARSIGYNLIEKVTFTIEPTQNPAHPEENQNPIFEEIYTREELDMFYQLKMPQEKGWNRLIGNFENTDKT